MATEQPVPEPETPQGGDAAPAEQVEASTIDGIEVAHLDGAPAVEDPFADMDISLEPLPDLPPPQVPGEQAVVEQVEDGLSLDDSADRHATCSKGLMMLRLK